MSEERPNKCPNCEAPVVWCACIVKSCPICNTIPKVGGGMIVHPLCDCFDEKYIEFDAWQSRPIEDELRAELARLSELLHDEMSQLEIATDLGNKRWIALNEIYENAEKHNANWCKRKAQEGLGIR